MPGGNVPVPPIVDGPNGPINDQGINGIAQHIIANTRRPRESMGSTVPLIESLPYRLPPHPVSYRDMFNVAELEPTIATCKKVIKFETFRGGGHWVPLWSGECGKCGRRYLNRNVRRGCADCNGDGYYEDLIPPDPKDYAHADEFFNNCNLNFQNIFDVLHKCEDDVNTVDDGYLILRKNYAIDKKNGRVVRADVAEAIPGPAIIMRPTGTTKGFRGGEFYTCALHRDVIYDHGKRSYAIFDQGQSNERARMFGYNDDREIVWTIAQGCPHCKMPLYDVEYIALHIEMGMPMEYYIHGEVIHWHKYRTSLTYGGPPMISLWLDALYLIYQKKYTKEYYEFKRIPNAIFTISTANPASFLNKWKEAMDYLKEDPHYIPVIPVDVDPMGGRTGQTEIHKFTDTLSENQYVETRQEARDRIMGFYGVSPRWTGDNSQTSTVGSTGYDFVVLNRTVEQNQFLYNEKIFPALLRALKVKNWRYILKPSEERDDMKDLEKKTKGAQYAMQMGALGFNVNINEEDDDKFEFIPPDDAPLALPYLEAAMNQAGPNSSLSQLNGATTFDPVRRGQDMHGQPEQVGSAAVKEMLPCPTCGGPVEYVDSMLHQYQCIDCRTMFTPHTVPYPYHWVEDNGGGMSIPPTPPSGGIHLVEIKKAPSGPLPQDNATAKVPTTHTKPNMHRPAGTQGGYKCSKCGKSFDTQQGLGGHMSKVHGAGGGDESGESGGAEEGPILNPDQMRLLDALAAALMAANVTVVDTKGKEGGEKGETGNKRSGD